jgi:hypothetical protein
MAAKYSTTSVTFVSKHDSRKISTVASSHKLTFCARVSVRNNVSNFLDLFYVFAVSLPPVPSTKVQTVGEPSEIFN